MFLCPHTARFSLRQLKAVTSVLCYWVTTHHFIDFNCSQLQRLDYISADLQINTKNNENELLFSSKTCQSRSKTMSSDFPRTLSIKWTSCVRLRLEGQYRYIKQSYVLNINYDRTNCGSPANHLQAWSYVGLQRLRGYCHLTGLTIDHKLWRVIIFQYSSSLQIYLLISVIPTCLCVLRF